jgi:hypothetical protein
LGNDQLRNQEGRQFRSSQRIDLAHCGDHPSIGTVFNHL